MGSPSMKFCPFYLGLVSNYKIAKLEICAALKHIHFVYNKRLRNKNPTSGTKDHFTSMVVSNQPKFSILVLILRIWMSTQH